MINEVVTNLDVILKQGEKNMAKSKLTFVRNTVNKLSVKGILSEDGTYITYTDENDCEQDIYISDLLNAFKNQEIEFAVQLKNSEDLDIIPVEEEDDES